MDAILQHVEAERTHVGGHGVIGSAVVVGRAGEFHRPLSSHPDLQKFAGLVHRHVRGEPKYPLGRSQALDGAGRFHIRASQVELGAGNFDTILFQA